MTRPRRKPSDDDQFWHGISVTQVNRRFLFDVLAVVMADMKRNDGRSPPLSFEQFRGNGVRAHGCVGQGDERDSPVYEDRQQASQVQDGCVSQG